MGKSFRFLLNFAWVNLGAIIAFAAVIIGGCYLTGVPDNSSRSNLFESYYAVFPTIILLCLFLYAFALCTNDLNLALSMGARRSDFFWAVQGIMVFYTVVCWALYWLMSIFPTVANWVVRERFGLLSAYSGQMWLYPMLCMLLLVLGCLSGLLIVKSKILGILVVILSTLVLMGTTMFIILFGTAGFQDILFHSVWNDLPKILVGVLALSCAGGELLIWRIIQRHVVR